MLVDNMDPTASRAGDKPVAGRSSRTDFWLTSILWGIALVYLTIKVILLTVIIRSDLAVGEFSAGELLGHIVPVEFWTFLMMIGTSYFSIPIATVIVAAVRGVYRHQRPECSES